jgi:1-hydroxycarotenoid 3,4-desaturase
MPARRVIVIGAGAGGLAAALDLAARGVQVTVLERASAPGGKLREVAIGGARLDAGPTVFTMRWVFEDLFAAAGAELAAHLPLRPVEVLARHAWADGARLDLYADRERSAEAIAEFAGAAEARRYREFCHRAAAIYRTLEGPFIRAPRPGLLELVRRVGVAGLGGLWRISPFATLWGALCRHFRDPRLRQLFGRYATYCGSSPWLAPATLMLVAHVEQDGVWLVEGGMHRIAVSLAALARARGAVFRYGTEATEVNVTGARVTGVTLAGGERLPADAVVVNADAGALAAGCFGARAAGAVPPVPRAARSLSALTWNVVARTAGFPLLRHTVFFSSDYAAEFDAIFRRARLPDAPTVYVCAQDRDDRDAAPAGPERLLCLVNAPATGDDGGPGEAELDRCEAAAFALLERCGLAVARDPAGTVRTAPAQFDALFPATGGALYGRASHGWRASFARPGSRTRVPGLYLAGGSVHPGPGVPMAALSGRLAAACVLADLGA